MPRDTPFFRIRRLDSATLRRNGGALQHNDAGDMTRVSWNCYVVDMYDAIPIPFCDYRYIAFMPCVDVMVASLPTRRREPILTLLHHNTSVKFAVLTGESNRHTDDCGYIALIVLTGS
jgi:hypothetical protein